MVSTIRAVSPIQWLPISPIKIHEKQIILETADIEKRLEVLMALMEGEVDILDMEKKIRVRVKQQMEKNQREYYLNEQMKAIQKGIRRHGRCAQ